MPDTAGPPPLPGGTSSPRVLRDRDGARAFIARLIEAAQREVDVFAPQLDPDLFNRAPLARAIVEFAARHRRNRVHFLVEDAAQALRDNECLADLCRRFGEAVELRLVDETHLGIREMFVVVDRTGYLHQQDTARFECVADTAGKGEAVKLALRFAQMWDRSAPVAGLHTPGLP